MNIYTHYRASLCGRSSAAYDADVWRNNVDDHAAMLSPER